MPVELFCPHCRVHLAAAPETPAAQALSRMAEAGPWSWLGDGETFEDSIVAALADPDANACPHCGESVTVSEESLGRLTMQVLATW
jgi:hypothetical protein